MQVSLSCHCPTLEAGGVLTSRRSQRGRAPSVHPRPLGFTVPWFPRGSALFVWRYMCNNQQKGDRKLVLIFTIACHGLFALSQDVLAQGWTQTTAPTNNWTGIASSAEGTKLAAISSGGGIYTSPDSGNTWTLATNAPLSAQWVSVSSSADGAKLIAAEGGLIYTSADSGLTWATNNVPSVLWTSVASSGDGRVLVAGAPFAQAPYVSTNFGSKWSSAPLPANDKNYATVSADGKRLTAVLQVGRIYTSTNFGTAWMTNTAPGLGYSAIASSADGRKLVAGTLALGISSYPGAVYTTTDAGATWVSNVVAQHSWTSFSITPDGTKIVAGISTGGAVYISANGIWTTNTIADSTAAIGPVAMSADGNLLVAAGVKAGGIWILRKTPAPTMNITPTNGNLTLSWIVPSTNFVVQESQDMISWSSIANTPALNFTNLNYELSISPSNSSGFYRLVTP
jgi:photosystem II stability/assembly factor-like uncharacterized protein